MEYEYFIPLIAYGLYQLVSTHNYDFRFIEVKFSNLKELNEFYKLEEKYNSEILDRRLKIFYTKSNKFLIILYGYDGQVKFTGNNLHSFLKIFSLIDKMPMSSTDSKKKSMKKNQNTFCGLPTYKYTSHCFNDKTHHTCCLLGKEARNYADNSGNPIGTASIKAFEKYYGFTPKENTLTPWCTCIGSMVCTFYQNKFNDGTHIKFVYDKNRNKRIIELNEDEKKLREELGYISHSTPGVY